MVEEKIEKFVSKYESTEIEAMFDKIKQDIQVIQYNQTEINNLLTKINNMSQPTKTSDLNNDSGFITNTINNLLNYYLKTETYSKTEVNTLINQQASGGFLLVNELPTTDISTRNIYLVPSTNSKVKNVKDEYINLDGTTNGWEIIGDTKINLSDYVTLTALNTALADYVSTTSFQNTLASYYTKTEVDNLISQIDTSGSGSNITVDNELSDTSTNPVQNSVIKEALDDKANKTAIGNLTELETTDKSDIVNAINEIMSRIPTVGTGGVGNGGYAPIGTVIAYMGTSAPSDFLICDGTVYNIADYTELADFFEAQFGSSNFFGGDGNTTFAVPDLRGEFLRGTGTNSHANQGSGANVGVHQDGTVHFGNVDVDNCYIAPKTDLGNKDYSTISKNSNYYISMKSGGDSTQFTSRPTNTSVLYCIKAKSQGNGYSLDEQIVGTWIDGKPIYQKTFTNVARGTSLLTNVDTLVDWRFLRPFSSNDLTLYCNYDGNDNRNALCIQLTNGSLSIENISNQYTSGNPIHATFQYTKTTDV